MVTSAELHVAAGELQRTASAIEQARQRFDQVLSRLDLAADRTSSAWTSAGAVRFVGDATHLRSVTARVPGRYQAAADTTRTLASTAESLAVELAGRERALETATEALASATRRLSSLDADDPGRSSLHETQRFARRSQRDAEHGMDLIRSRWGAACSSTGSTVAMVADVLRSDATSASVGPVDGPTIGPPSGPSIGPGRPGAAPAPDGFSWGGAIESATGVLASNVVRMPLAVHGAALFVQRVRALGTMVDAYVTRGYHRVMRPWRAAGTAAARIATLRWWGVSEAMAASRARTDIRIEAQSNRMSRAGSVMRAGSGVVAVAGKVLAPLSMFQDVTTITTGGQYEGTRGGIDVAMAGVGLVSTVVLLAPAAVIGSPVIIGAAVVGATAAAVWGIGNLIYDNRAAIGSALASAGQGVVAAASWAGSGLASAGSTIASGVGAAGSALASGASNVGSVLASGASSVSSAVGSGLSSAGSSLASGAGSVVSSVGGFLGFGG